MLLTVLLGLLINQSLCFIPVTGALSGIDSTSKSLPVRQEILMFSYEGPVWDLYIQALSQFQNTPFEDELSFFEIAGIHGFPQKPWNDVKGNGTAGFCMHGSVLFPIWHRPYLALYEQILSEKALSIAETYPAQERDAYRRAAENMRIPYWDWTINFRLPEVVTALQLEIRTATGKRNVTNPLYQYTFPLDMRNTDNLPTPFNYGILPNLTYTARHYDISSRASNQSAASEMVAGGSGRRLQDVYQMLVANGNWTKFACYSIDKVKNSYPNIEAIHGQIHNAVGGFLSNNTLANGHMTVTDLSAFDPVFWLHHANVDRLTAIWQVLHDRSYIEPTINYVGSYFQLPNQYDTQSTQLAPFYNHDGSEMWTPAAARNIAAFGYTYPELTGTDSFNLSSIDTVRARVNQLYNPLPSEPDTHNIRTNLYHSIDIAEVMCDLHADKALQLGINNLEVQWRLRIQAEEESMLNIYSAFIFIGKAPKDRQIWPRARNLIASYIPPLLNGIPRDTDQNAVKEVDIPCTHLVAVAVNRGALRNTSVESVVSFLRSYVTIEWVPTLETKRGANVDAGLYVSIISQRIRPRKALTEFPCYEHIEIHGHLVDGRREDHGQTEP